MMRTNNVRDVCAVAGLLALVACSGTGLSDVSSVAGAGAGGSASSDRAVAGSSPRGSSGNVGSNNVVGAVPVGGSGAATGLQGGPDLLAGAGGEPESEPLECPRCVTVATGQDVRSIAANDRAVFWVDYGTTDSLGNYESNGRLLSRSLADGTTSVVADSLPGPELVSLSSHYAYMFVDQLVDPLNAPRGALGVIRVPLGGGAMQRVQSLAAGDRSLNQFAAAPGYEYWSFAGAVSRIAEVDDASAEIFVAARSVSHVFADDARLYFQDPAGLWTVPLAGGEPTELSATYGLDLELLNGDYLYALETGQHSFDTACYLTRMPKLGGAWKRVYLSPNDQIWSQVAVDGDRYLIDEPTFTERRILQGSLAAPATPITLASQAFSGNESWTWKAWAYSKIGVFFASSDRIYLVPTASP